MRHLLSLFEVTDDELLGLLKSAARIKKARGRRKEKLSLQGKVIAMIFEKPSLRTRVSFQAAIAQLGGTGLFIPGSEVGLGTRESVPDFARTISNYIDAVVLRTFKQETVDEFARHATCPVINGLSDYYHPCQALGDLLTIEEVCGKAAGRTVAFIGEGNNVARSLAVGCGKLGARFILAAPDGYGFDAPFLDMLKRNVPEAQLIQNGDPRHAVESADILYTDVWTSMGQEAETELRRAKFAGFQINGELLGLAPPSAHIMHCLPAHRGEEITADVLDSDRSVIFQQAANRMHAQKALLEWLLQ